MIWERERGNDSCQSWLDTSHPQRDAVRTEEADGRAIGKEHLRTGREQEEV